MNRCSLPYANWKWPEFKAALGAFATGRVGVGPDIDELENQIGQLLGEPNIFAVNSGRTALRIGLEGLAKLRPERREVIIPAYICPAVVNTIKSAGLCPVPSEVGPDLNLHPESAHRLIHKDTLAILVAHMYGCPADIVAIEGLAKKNGIYLIDDAAQVVGESINGRQLGTFGDFGLISFAQSKCLIAGESGAGGILICQNPELTPIAHTHVESLGPARSRGRAFLTFVWSYLLSGYTNKVTYYWRRVVPSSPKGISPARIANLDARIALCQLKSLARRRLERISVLDKYVQQLSTLGLRLPQYTSGKYLARAMTLLPAGSNVESCREQLRSHAIETRRGYPVFLTDDHSSPYAREMTDRLIELPLAPGMSDTNVKRICEHLGETLKKQEHCPSNQSIT